MQPAMPIARPPILMNEKLLCFRRFLHAILTLFLNMRLILRESSSIMRKGYGTQFYKIYAAYPSASIPFRKAITGYNFIARPLKTLRATG
jgi:hypothetical protein